MDDAEFALGELQLNSGDALFCYTDGLLDIRNSAGDSFGGDNLRSLVKGKGKDISALVAEIVAALDSFSAGAVQYDDITMLGMRKK